MRFEERYMQYQQYEANQEQQRAAWEADGGQRVDVENNRKAVGREHSQLQRHIDENPNIH